MSFLIEIIRKTKISFSMPYSSTMFLVTHHIYIDVSYQL